jgi:membrane protein
MPIWKKTRRRVHVWRTLQYYLGGLYRRTDDNHFFLFGAGLAFVLFVCIVPLLLIIFSVLGHILTSPVIESQVNAMIDGIIPYSDYAGNVKQFITSRLQEFVRHKEAARYTGILGLLFAASGLFSSMRTILDKIYRVEIDSSIVKDKLKDFILVLSVVFFTSISMILFPVLEIVVESADKWAVLAFFRFSMLQELFFSAMAFLLVVIMFFVLYYFVPSRRAGLKTALVSAVAAAVLWEIAKQLFGYYITHLAAFDRIYGAYIFIVVVAFWIYYSSLVFILGAEIGQLYKER